LAADGPGQRVAAAAAREQHVVDAELEVVNELSLDDQPMIPVSHATDDGTVGRAQVRIAGRSPG